MNIALGSFSIFLIQLFRYCADSFFGLLVIPRIQHCIAAPISATNSSKAYPSVEWSVEVDKQKAAQLGVSVGDVGALVQMLTNGFKVGEYRPDDSKDEIEIRARFDSELRSLSGIKDLKVNSINGLIPISTFIKLVPAQNRQSVIRRNGKYFHEIGIATRSGYLVSDTEARDIIKIENEAQCIMYHLRMGVTICLPTLRLNDELNYLEKHTPKVEQYLLKRLNIMKQGYPLQE